MMKKSTKTRIKILGDVLNPCLSYLGQNYGKLRTRLMGKMLAIGFCSGTVMFNWLEPNVVVGEVGHIIVILQFVLR